MKKINIRPIILIILGGLILLLIAIGIVFRYGILNNPVTLTTLALEKVSEKLDDERTYGRLAEYFADEDTYEMNLNGKIMLPDNMGNLSIDTLLQQDNDREVAFMNFDMKLNNNDLLYLESQMDRQALYLSFKKNANKYYYTNELSYIEGSEIDFDSFTDKFIESFREVVRKEDFIQSEKEILINDISLKTKEYSLKLTTPLVKSIMERFFTKIEYDRELMHEIARDLNKTEIEIKDSFDATLNDINIDSELYYNLYVYKNNVVRFELIDDKNSIVLNDYKNPELNINIVDDFNEKATISIKENMRSWVVDIESSIIKITGSISEEKYDLNIKQEDLELKISGTNDYRVIHDGLKGVLKGNITGTQAGNNINVSYEFNINLREIERVNLKDIYNKVDINNMTPSEEAELQKDIKEIPLVSILVGNLMGSLEEQIQDECCACLDCPDCDVCCDCNNPYLNNY